MSKQAISSHAHPHGAAHKPGLLDRVLGLPRMYRWLLALVVAIVVWMFANDYVWSWAEDLNDQSERIERAIEDGARRRRIVASNPEIQQAIESLGRISVPRAERDGTQELSKSVTAVMQSNKLEEFSWEVRAGAKLPPSSLQEIAGEGGRIEKVIGTLKFDASPELASKIISELESRPEIESISQLKLSKKGGADKKVAVNLTVEAWIQVSRRGA